jgi:hypothetical protein
MVVADVDFPTPPLWLVRTKTGVMIEVPPQLNGVNETACKTNELPTRVMLSGGSAVSLRDGTSRCNWGRALLPHCTAKPNQPVERRAITFCCGKEMEWRNSIIPVGRV